MKNHQNKRQRKGTFNLLTIAFFVFLYVFQIHSPGIVYSQTFPKHPIVVINPFEPGGGTDVELRNMSPYLKKNLGQPIILKSIPGGGTTLATAEAAKAKPDGYTVIVFVTPTASLAQVLLNAEYRVEDFEYIYAWFEGPSDLTVDVDSPYKTFQDLMTAGKKKKLKAAVAGIGSSSHLNGVLLEEHAGIKAVYIPYAGGGPATTATIRGDVDFFCGLSTTSIRFVQGGQMRQLAVLGPKPLEALPNTPTIYELGYKDFPNIPFVRGIAAPPGTPKAIIKFLAGAFQKSVDDPGFRAIMKKQGRPVTNMTGAEMKKIVVDGFKLSEKYVPIMKNSIK